jgi:hypothetical protein
MNELVKIYVSQLIQNKKILQELLNDIPPERYTKSFGKEIWTVKEHVKHLAEVQPIQIERIKLFVENDNPEIVPYYPESNSSNSNNDIMISHDLIDNIERDIALDLGIHLVIHLDPLVVGDPFVNELQRMTEEVVKGIEGSLSIHDFRVVKGSTHNNLIFDVLVPYDCKISNERIQERIMQKINQLDKLMMNVEDG